jgi:hypothetical protein
MRILINKWRLVWAAAALTTLLSLSVAGIARVDPVAPGLSASYETFGAAGRTTDALDAPPSTARMRAHWADAPPDAFRATWRGTIFIPNDGAYRFATRSDDESAIYLDGRQVVENGGRQPGDAPVRGIAIRPDRGSHTIVITYLHNGGAPLLEVLWAHGDDDLEAVPGWALRARRVGVTRILASRYLPPVLASAEWLAFFTAMIAIGATCVRWLAKLRAYLRRDGASPMLAWIVAGSTLLNIVGLWWGLPAGDWIPIELTPVLIIEGIAQHFSHGWYDAYPPVHYYVLAIADSPVFVLDWLGRISVYQGIWSLTLVVIGRSVSVVMAAGTLVAIDMAGRLAFSRRAGLFATALFALAAPLLYYAKAANVDVPYIFWFALSLIFYLRVLRDGRLRDYLALAVATTLSICTKDQAYGLYVLLPFVIVWQKGFNRRAVAAGVTSIVLFALCHNLLFNVSGFKEHLGFITGFGSVYYRIFDPTLLGRWLLLKLSVRLTELSWGWPGFLVCLAGVVMAWHSGYRRTTVALLASIVGYYFSFLNVILYAYDRFLLPVCLVLALFGGFALDRCTSQAGRNVWRYAAVALMFAYTLLYTSTVDILMLRDSRYAVERWLDARGGTKEMIGVNVLQNYLPRLDKYNTGDVQTIDDLKVARPKYFILNVDYTIGEGPESKTGPLIAGLRQHTLGYSLAYRVRTPSPWPWLPGGHRDLVGPRLNPIGLSTLRNINPTMEVYERDAP